jgi:hypothetical protein
MTFSSLPIRFLVAINAVPQHRPTMILNGLGRQIGPSITSGDKMLDIHCHILPGVDDGPRTLEEALAVA